MLSTIDMAYKDLKKRTDIISMDLSADEMVRLAFKKKLGKIRKNDIAELCPSISISAIEKGIAKILADGEIEKKGSGKNTFYVKK